MSTPARAHPARTAEESRICELFLPRIGIYGRRHLRDSDVDDFCQDVILATLDAVRSGKVAAENLGGYVLGICRNLAAGRWRREEIGKRAIANVAEAPAVQEDPAPAFFERWHLEDCLSRLTERARRVLRLSYCEDHTAEEVGADMKIETGHVRVLRHRALAQLKECLASDPYGAAAR